jgi:hypothetical protein
MADSGHSVMRIEPGAFENYLHWYPKALNAAIHPLVLFFLHLDNRHIVDRYCHLHPTVNEVVLSDLLSYQPSFYRWAGVDLINVTNARGKRQMVVIENNSCPSGQKSMPLPVDHRMQGGYRELIEQSFKPFLTSSSFRKKGVLAVFYDKNFMETSGYAASMADVFQEPVYLVAMQDKSNPHIRCTGEYIEILTAENEWSPVAAAFRYVTQRPWNRIPTTTATKIYNPVITCLAGGRNKLMAAKAYEDLNKELKPAGLKIRIPETIRDVRKEDVPAWIKHFGGQAVVKIPYSNAGQGVYTIVNEKELKAFMRLTTPYEKLIVQSLIGNYRWSSKSMEGRFYHLGTVPDHKGESYVFDLRMMVCATPSGFRPISLYSRRAEKPLPDRLTKQDDSWSILGTNLSRLVADNEWTTDTNRLLLMDRRDFNTLGLGLDDLIEAYVQSIMSTVAIDKMAIRLTNRKGKFRRKLFASMNQDKTLISEIMKST